MVSPRWLRFWLWPGFRTTLGKGEAHFLRGSFYSQRGQWATAAAAYEAALAENEQPAEWHFQLGVARGKLHEWDRAVAAYEKALTRDNGNAAWHFCLGHAQAKLENWDAASEACEAALARDDTRAEWHACLGRFRTRLKDWNGAIACFDAAIARDGRNAEWFFQRGVVQEKLHEFALAAASYDAALARNVDEPKYARQLKTVQAKMEAWTRRANAYCLALNADPNDDEARRRAAICFARSGNEADAIAILAPTVAKSDALLNGFLVSRNRNDNTPVQRKVLFGRGGRTALARKIVLGPDAEPDVYFEHTRQDRSGAERVRDFYALASAMDGVAPRFVPRLHYCRLTNTGGYFLFDYLEVDARREGQFFDRTAELDRKLALRVVDSLVEVSSLQYPPGRAAPDGTGLRDLFAQNVEAVERHIQSEFEKHPDDAEYRRSLQSLSRGWANHQRRLNETPEIFSHGNAQRPNAIITKSGEIYLVDWETHGMAPVGIDFVALFLDRCESAEFEELGELYLRRVMPSMGAMERRAILALLAVTTSAVRGRSIPRKWLHGLESMTPRRNQRFSTVRLA